MPPPLSYCSTRPLIRGAVLTPAAAGAFELLIVANEGIGPQDLARVQTRIEAIKQVAQRNAPMIVVRLIAARDLAPSLFAWAAVVAGDLPELTRTGPFDWNDTFARSPNALLRCLMLLVPKTAPGPLAVLRSGQAPTRLVDFLALWSGNAVVRDVAALENRTLSPQELDGLARQFRRACLLALRQMSPPSRRSLRATLGPSLFGSRIPSVFRPHLERLLQTHRAQEVQLERGWQLELDGLVLARALSLDQLRALATRECPQLAPAGPIWQRLAAVIENPQARGLVSLEPEFLKHLLIAISANGRPRAQRVDTPNLIRFAVKCKRSNLPLDVFSSPDVDRALAARTSLLMATPVAADENVALQLGAQVLVIGPHQSRLFPLARAFRRPRSVTWVPEKAEMIRALRKPLASGLPTIQVAAFPDGDGQAAVYALDATGALYREPVAHAVLEQTLQEMREVLRQAQPAYILAASVHAVLASLAGQKAESNPPIILSVTMTPAGDQAELDGERFGAGAPLSWGALAEAVLSQWSPGVWAHVGVNRVKAPTGTSALALLAARARVLRRLHTHLHRISRQLRAA